MYANTYTGFQLVSPTSERRIGISRFPSLARTRRYGNVMPTTSSAPCDIDSRQAGDRIPSARRQRWPPYVYTVPCYPSHRTVLHRIACTRPRSDGVTLRPHTPRLHVSTRLTDTTSPPPDGTGGRDDFTSVPSVPRVPRVPSVASVASVTSVNERGLFI